MRDAACRYHRDTYREDGGLPMNVPRWDRDRAREAKDTRHRTRVKRMPDPAALQAAGSGGTPGIPHDIPGLMTGRHGTGR
jgi:hypothetical protein